MKIQMRLCVLLTALLLLCTIPALSAEAATIASGTCGTNATWTLDSNGVLTISGSGSMSGYDVANEQPWYSYQSQITAIVVEEGITFVAKHAFSGCGATTISLPSTLKWIGKYAFAYNRSLTEVVIPASVTEIDDWAFNDCQSLKTLTIKGKVTLGSAVFATCSRLKTIYFEGDAPYGAEATIFGGVTATAYYPAGNNTYTDAAKACVGGNLTWIPQYKASGTCGDNLTWTLDANGVLTISGIGDMPYYETENEQPWYSCRSQIKAIVVEEGVTSVGWHAFSGIDAATVSLPSTLTNIAKVSFAYNEALTDLVIPANVKKIGDWAFMDCTALKTLRIQGNVTLGSAAFNSCSALTTIYFEGNAPDGAEATIFSGVTATAYYPAGNSTYSDLSKIHVGGNLTWIPQYKANGTCGDNLTWTLDDSGTLTISGSGDMVNSSINGSPFCNYCEAIKNIFIDDGITSIGDHAFSYCPSLVSVDIPGSVTYIGDGAFYDCSSLTSVEIPGSVTTIGGSAFIDCDGLKSVSLSEGLTTIEYAAFMNCPLTSIELPSTVTSIGGYAFYGAEVSSVTIPKNVSSIGITAFGDWKAFSSVTFLGSAPAMNPEVFRGLHNLTAYYPACNPTWTEDKRQNYGGEITWVPLNEGNHSYEDGICVYCGAEEITTIGGSCGENATWTLDVDGTLTISGNGEMYSSPFSEHLADVKNVVIENGITSIGNNAFDGCSNLTSIEIPNSVSIIRQDAFSGCSSLSSIEIPDGVTFIENGAFKNCSSLTSVAIPDGVLSLEYDVFSGCSFLTSIEIPNSVTSIRDNALSGCGFLTSIEIPDGVTYIGDGAFSGCANLISIDIPDGVTSIGNSLFAGCLNLSSVVIPDSVTSIGSQAFTGCSKLTSVKIPEGLTSIGNYAFSKCSSLTSIDIPGSVTSIGKYTFSGCSSLGSVTFQGSAPSLASDAFDGIGMFTANYPSNLPGWDEAINSNYGAESITWEPYTLLIDLEGATMTLSNSLSMNFVVDADYLVGDGHYAVITRTYADGSTDKVTCSQDKWTSYNKDENHWYFTYENIAAKEMTDVLTVVIYNSNNEAVSNEWIDSPRDYCMRAIEDEEADKKDPEKLALYVDMLNYGAAAQTYFGYQTDDLANEDLSDAQKAYATTAEISVTSKQVKPNEGYKGGSLTLVNEIRLNFVFYTEFISQDMYAIATYIDHYGNEKEVRIEGKDFKAESNKALMISVTGMAVADYDQAVTCTVYDANDKEIISATDSVACYVLRAKAAEADNPLFDTVLKFGYSAYQAFKK